MTIETIPLDQLYLHPLNPRGDTGPEDAALMAAAIRDVGLIQNLAGFRDPDQPGIGIVAGGRRLRGLLALEAADELPDSLSGGIPVTVTSDPIIARTWASAENEHRALDPVDQVRAFAGMAESGLPVASIASACAVTEGLVRRRLKLASLPDEVLDALKAREISLDVAAAMTTTNDQERVLRLLETVRGQDWTGHRVRAELHSGLLRATDRRAVFVGLDSYEAAGGGLERDLFTEECWLHSEDLLDRLFAEKLEDAAEAEKARGWKFVLTSDAAWPRGERKLDDFEEISPEPGDLSEAEAEEMQALENTQSWKLTPEQLRHLKELRRKRRGTFTAEQSAGLGCLLYVNIDGDLDRIDGLRRIPEMAAEGEPTAAKDPAPAEDTATPPISAALREDLAAIVLHQRQRALLDHSSLALDLLAYQLSGLSPWSRPLQIDAREPGNTPTVVEGLETEPRLTDEVTDRNPASAKGFAAFRKRGQKHRNAVLTMGLARLLGPNHGDDLAAMLDQLTGVSVRRHWAPTTKGFFARLRGAHLDAIFEEILPDAATDRREAFAALTVKEKARELGDLFTNADTRAAWDLTPEQVQRLAEWIPAEMRELLGKMNNRVNNSE